VICEKRHPRNPAGGEDGCDHIPEHEGVFVTVNLQYSQDGGPRRICHYPRGDQ